MKTHSYRSDLRAIRLDTNTLSELVGCLLEGFIKPSVDISTNFDTTDIRETTLNSFLAHTELPDSIDNLSIRMYEQANDQGVQSLSLVLYKNYINLSISGASETSILGKSQQMNYPAAELTGYQWSNNVGSFCLSPPLN
jgi:hypothetical protein